MKHPISLFCVLLMAVMSMRAEVKMTIQYIDKTEYTEAISAIARWEIDGENEKFRLIALDGTLLAEKHLYDDVRRIVLFDDNDEDVVNTNDTDLSVCVYPNPTTEMLYIDGINAGETIRIFSLDGQLLVAEIACNAALSLDVKPLNSGVYLLQIGTEIVKFIKR